ncbi:MAG TPA: nucleotidyl transferase AbiEii/AbiGii toxin family protein [Thermoanaerobaculia bacterium]|nr:nucleotidyl transferase AbiEii/AbiGii toxin family protein [Thermoanaerobaculia bacterium]
MFRREEHRAVLRVLQALDANLLEGHHTLFGGGTRLVLELGEYRISQDIDFLSSDARAFAELRNRARQDGPRAFFDEEGLSGLEFPREIRADQYGIRFPLVADGWPIKFEIIREGRIELEAGARPSWAPVGCLTLPDAYAEKLLSNSDRWPDRQLLARDLIDLGMLRSEVGPIPGEAWSKAETAYGAAPRRDLRKALDAFLGDPAFQQRCFTGLSLSAPDEVLEGVGLLLSDLEGG